MRVSTFDGRQKLGACFKFFLTRPPPWDTCVALPTKHEKKVGTTKTMEARLPPFFYEDIPFLCSISERFHRAKLWQTGYELLVVHCRERAKATALFVSSFGADLVAEV